jgi:hypothetical protein
MRLKYDPFRLIFNQGDDVVRLLCLEFLGFIDSPRAKTCLLSLIKQQHLCGTFSSHLDPAQWGMQETIRNILLFLKAGLPPNSLSVSRPVQFILKQQRLDGGWSENPLLRIPLEQTWLSNRRSISWLTADAVELLHRIGLSERFEYLTAVEFLRSLQNQDGSWPSFSPNDDPNQSHIGDPDPTAQITFLMGELYGKDDPVYQKGKSRFESYLDECAYDVKRGYRIRVPDRKKEKIEVYHLTHLLLSWILDPPRRFDNGYDIHDRRVKQIMEALIEIQGEDGGWCPFFADTSSPTYTLIALKVLVLSGMITRDTFDDEIKEYIF